MAKVELDISEYNSIMDNKKLLEESLCREKELSSKVEKLLQEKNDVLLSNSKKVTIVNKSETVTRVLVKNTGEDIFYNLKNYFENERYRNLNRYNQFDLVENLVDTIFTIEKEFYVSDPEITYEGLDEIKKVIKTDYINSLTAEVTSKLESITNLSADNIRLRAEVDRLSKLENFSKENLELVVENAKLKSTIKFLVKQIKNIKRFALNKSSIFNIQHYKSKLLKAINVCELGVIVNDDIVLVKE